MNLDSAYTGSCTRRFLGFNAGMMGAVFDSVEQVLDHFREGTPGGLVYALALREGASQHHAESAGVSAELWYAACSLTDDIQDGESDYAGDTLAEQVNVQSLLICLAFLSLGALGLGERFALRGVGMLSGQYEEISTEIWSLEKYNDVGMKIAGYAFGLYMILVAVAARGWDGIGSEYCEDWRRYGEAYGILLQVVVDAETDDERWTSLPEGERERYASEVREKFVKSAARVGAQDITEILLRRLQCVELGQSSGGNI